MRVPYEGVWFRLFAVSVPLLSLSCLACAAFLISPCQQTGLSAGLITNTIKHLEPHDVHPLVSALRNEVTFPTPLELFSFLCVGRLSRNGGREMKGEGEGEKVEGERGRKTARECSSFLLSFLRKSQCPLRQLSSHLPEEMSPGFVDLLESCLRSAPLPPP